MISFYRKFKKREKRDRGLNGDYLCNGVNGWEGAGGCSSSVNALRLMWVVTEWVCLVGTNSQSIVMFYALISGHSRVQVSTNAHSPLPLLI